MTKTQAFLTPLPSTGDVPIVQFVNYGDSLLPLLEELRMNLHDREIEHRQASEPLFCLDYSELHYLVTSRRTLKGRLGRIGPADMMMDRVIGETNVRLCLPPGTIMEIVHSNVDMPHTDSITESIVRLIREPASGASRLPRVGDILRALPDKRKLLDLLRDKSDQAHLRPLTRLIASGRLQLFHTTEYARSLKWDNAIFRAAIDSLTQRAHSKDFSDLWDALNLVICSNTKSGTSRSVAPYLVSRARSLADAAAQLPAIGSLHYQTSHSGLVRSPQYLYLYSMMLSRTQSSADLLHFGELVNSLDEIRRAYSLMTADAILQGQIPGKPSLARLLEAKVRAFHGDYERECEYLFAAWEASRQYRAMRFLPFSGTRLEWVQDGKDPEVELVEEAERARQFLINVSGDESKSGAEETLRTEVTHDTTFPVVHTGVWARGAPLPLVLIDFVQDYFSAWWLSSLDLHEFLDWVERFYAVVTPYARQSPIARRERQRNWNYMTVPAGNPDRKLCRESDDPGILPAGERLDFPLSFGARARLLASVEDAQALRIFTPYGDLWINTHYRSPQGLRTGIASHYPISAFLSTFVGLTSPVAVSIPKVHDQISRLLTDHLAVERSPQ